MLEIKEGSGFIEVTVMFMCQFLEISRNWKLVAVNWDVPEGEDLPIVLEKIWTSDSGML